MILISLVGGDILIYFSHSKAFFSSSSFSFLNAGEFEPKASSMLSMFSTDGQLVFPGTMLDSEARKVN